MTIDQKAPIKRYSKKDLTFLYECSYRTLKIWLEPFILEIGDYVGGAYNINQVIIIFEKIGHPYVNQ